MKTHQPLRLSPQVPLFHWAPTNLRARIRREGIRTGQPSAMGDPLNGDGTPWYAPWVCLGVTPADALNYLGRRTDRTYDLWQVDRDPTDHVRTRRDGGPVVIEVRIHNDIAPTRIRYIATTDLRISRRR